MAHNKHEYKRGFYGFFDSREERYLHYSMKRKVNLYHIHGINWTKQSMNYSVYWKNGLYPSNLILGFHLSNKNNIGYIYNLMDLIGNDTGDINDTKEILGVPTEFISCIELKEKSKGSRIPNHLNVILWEEFVELCLKNEY